MPNIIFEQRCSCPGFVRKCRQWRKVLKRILLQKCGKPRRACCIKLLETVISSSCQTKVADPFGVRRFTVFLLPRDFLHSVVKIAAQASGFRKKRPISCDCQNDGMKLFAPCPVPETLIHQEVVLFLAVLKKQLESSIVAVVDFFWPAGLSSYMRFYIHVCIGFMVSGHIGFKIGFLYIFSVSFRVLDKLIKKALETVIYT